MISANTRPDASNETRSDEARSSLPSSNSRPC
jgi:hypothetical protein